MDQEEFGVFYQDMFPRLIQFAIREIDTPDAAKAATATLRTIWSQSISFPSTEADLQSLETYTFIVMKEEIQNIITARPDAEVVGYTTDIARRTIQNKKTASILNDLQSTERDVLGLIADGYAVGEIAAILGKSPADTSALMLQAHDHFAALLSVGSANE